jgi:hypothetical protein
VSPGAGEPRDETKRGREEEEEEEEEERGKRGISDQKQNAPDSI